MKYSTSLLIFEIIKCFIWSNICLEKCIKLKKKKPFSLGAGNAYIIKTIQVQTVVLTAFHFCACSRGNTTHALLVQGHNCLSEFRNNKIVDKLEVFNEKISKRILSRSFFASFPAVCVQQNVLACCPSLKYLPLPKCLSPSLCPEVFCLIKWVWWGSILLWEWSRRAFKTAGCVLSPSILVAFHWLWARQDCCSYLLLSVSFLFFYYFLFAVVLLAAVALANTSEGNWPLEPSVQRH